MIEKLNDEAEKKAEDVEFWYGVMQEFFAFLKEDSRFVAKVQDELNRFDRSEIQRDYAVLCRKFKRQHSSIHKLLNKFIVENGEYLFESFIEHLSVPDVLIKTIEIDDEPKPM